MDAWWLDRFAPEGVYLNSAAMGLPPAETVEAALEAVRSWAGGGFDRPAYDAAIASSRERYARLVGVAPHTVAVGSQTSAFVGLVAASLPDGARVVLASHDYCSLTFPFHAERDRLDIEVVPLADIVDAVRPGTALVAVSRAQSADGTLVDLEALEAACSAVGAEILLDVTQSAGWALDDLSSIGYTVCSAYKWLMAPRGAMFATVRDDLVSGIRPITATVDGAATHDFYANAFDPAPDASRFSVSPAWPTWLAAERSLALLEDIGLEQVHAHVMGVTARACSLLGVEATGSPILSVPVDADPMPALRNARVVASMRGGGLRVSFGIHTSESDAEALARALTRA